MRFSMIVLSLSILIVTSTAHAQTADVKADLRQVDKLVKKVMSSVNKAKLDDTFGETPRIDLVRKAAKERRIAAADCGDMGCRINDWETFGLLCPPKAGDLDKAVDTVEKLLETPAGKKAYAEFEREYAREQAAELLRLVQRPKVNKSIGPMPMLTAWVEGKDKTKAAITVAASR